MARILVREATWSNIRVNILKKTRELNYIILIISRVAIGENIYIK